MTHREEVYDAAMPFAHAIDDGMPIRQMHLDQLQTAFDAKDNPDFSVVSYQTEGLFAITQGKLFHLPFRLALGIHDSRPPEIDEVGVSAVYDRYLDSETPDIEDYVSADHKYRMQERVESAIFGAVVDAAGDRRFSDRMKDVKDYIRKEKLIRLQKRRHLKSAVEIVSAT